MRWKRGAPSSCSSLRICWLTEGCATLSSWAARVKWRCRLTDSKYVSWCISIGPNYSNSAFESLTRTNLVVSHRSKRLPLRHVGNPHPRQGTASPWCGPLVRAARIVQRRLDRLRHKAVPQRRVVHSVVLIDGLGHVVEDAGGIDLHRLSRGKRRPRRVTQLVEHPRR